MTLSLSGRNVIQAAVTVGDLDRATEFYRQTLGLPLLFQTNGMSFFELGNMRLLVGCNGDEQPSRGTVIYFEAPDLDVLRRALELKGVWFEGPTEVLQRTASHELKLASFRDPDGNALALLGEVPL